MITQDQFYEILDSKDDSILCGVDHEVEALNTLRSSIPYDQCPYIISAALPAKIFLCSVEVALNYLSVEDVKILAECNVGHEYDTLVIFV